MCVLVSIKVTFIPDTEIVEGGQVGVHLQAGILMILPVLPMDRLVSEAKQPRLRVIHIPSLFKGKILDLRKTTEDVAVLTQDNCQGVFLVVAVLVEAVCSEAISSPSVEQSKLKILSSKPFQEELNIIKISDEVTGATFDLDVLGEKQVFDAVTRFG